jgi:hypothetical protein
MTGGTIGIVVSIVGKDKMTKKVNIFKTPQDLKVWALELSDACGSKITNKKPNLSKVNALVEQMSKDYNEMLSEYNSLEEE